jgi:ribonuclease III
MSYEAQLEQFQARFGLKFINVDLLAQAFTHSSYANEHQLLSNERLEFLGDAVLEIAVSEFLYENFPEEGEGFLTKKRAKNVCEPALCLIANKMNLGAMMRLGKGEEESGGREKCSTLSDAFEALLGAIYLDRGYSAIFDVLDPYLFTQLIDDNFDVDQDFKSNLQEFVQADSKEAIEYRVIEEIGPPHNKTFTCAVYMGEVKMGVGTGKTKKEAEQSAAKSALEKLAKETNR